jgi:hypothetical protein
MTALQLAMAEAQVAWAKKKAPWLLLTPTDESHEETKLSNEGMGQNTTAKRD